MAAVFVAILAYSLNATVTVIDKFLLKKSIPSPVTYGFFVGILSIFVLPLFLLEFDWPGWGSVLFDLGTGMVFLLAILFLFTALKKGEASRVLPVIGGVIPLVIFCLNFRQNISKKSLPTQFSY